MRRRLPLALSLLASLLPTSCAKHVPLPAPEAEDYVFPAPAPGELSSGELRALHKGWQQVLSGDVAGAGRRLRKLERSAGAGPALQTALAYVALRGRRFEQAASSFAAALERAPSYPPALVGAAATALRKGDADGALAFLRRAQAQSPGALLVRKRLANVKLLVTERHMGTAQAALEAGDLEGAAAEYGRALDAAPEVAGVRLALAEVLVRRGDPDGALAALAADPSGDRQVKLRLAGLLADDERFDDALAVYHELLRRDPQDAVARRGEALARERFETAAMPQEYRRIPTAELVTRADLAALVVVRLKSLRRVGAGEPQVAVDISGSWAREQIASALALEIMDLYPNHTFQPGMIVRRVEAARTAARVLDRLNWSRAAAPAPSDMPRSHLDYDAVQRVLGAGLMGLNPAGAFEPWRPVSGPEAVELVSGLARLVEP